MKWKRKEFDLRNEDLEQFFSWIDSIIPIFNFMPDAVGTWKIKFQENIVPMLGAKKEFLVFLFYLRKWKRVMLCWRRRDVIVVFYEK